MSPSQEPSSPPAIKKVTLLGANGKLGLAVLHALLSANFTVQILKRSSSTTPDDFGPNIPVHKISDEFTISDLVPVLRGQDALVATIKGSQVEIQRRLADACVQAGVYRFIPADFGSCDSSSALTQNLVPLYKRKTELREYLQGLAREKGNEGKFTWTSVASFIHVWPGERRADVLSDPEDVKVAGKWRASFSTLARVGEATARLLLYPDVGINQMVFVQSFCLTQKEVVEAFQRVSGREWDVRILDSESFRKEEERKRDEGGKQAVEELVWWLGTVDAEWTKRGDFVNGALRLEDEGLDDVVKRVLKEDEEERKNGGK
ncbi:hypothetical protein LTR78_005167 [Recurvomyces mirabilis]|uniref:NmrA-like domain-containing protein n=1 Tax=Recurvomyces mirabilis TaxID=574656 RepID=A0AAE0WN56_9PEZI|nr:hypothetical protein LTR78_005167 [Recurvomyces mirabilis]KAK5157717.1 hypothetical protein LTS14_003639 [Recurvomyces mirabilis]